jgi:hypothetical protein
LSKGEKTERYFVHNAQPLTRYLSRIKDLNFRVNVSTTNRTNTLLYRLAANRAYATMSAGEEKHIAFPFEADAASGIVFLAARALP